MSTPDPFSVKPSGPTAEELSAWAELMTPEEAAAWLCLMTPEEAEAAPNLFTVEELRQLKGAQPLDPIA